MGGLVVGLLIVASGLGLLWLAWLGSKRRLAPNSWVGLRTRSTRSTDAAWYGAHEAAAAPLGVTGGSTAFLGLAIVVAGFDVIGKVAAVIAVGVVVIGTTIAGIVGVRAASANSD